MAMLGLGKIDEDEHYTSNLRRKELDTELELSVEQTQKRQVRDTITRYLDHLNLQKEKVEKDKLIQDELKEINKPFYCQLCNKQYTKSTEYEVHLGLFC
jgi:hypothetical protein